MIYAPVLIPTLNRLEHLKKCISSLQNNPLARYTDLYIALDYPPNDTYMDGYIKVKDYLEHGIDGFRHVTVTIRPYNYYYSHGNLGTMIGELYATYDRIIVLEDDIEVSPDFLYFMNSMLDLYKDDNRIRMISSFAYPIEYDENTFSVTEMTFVNCWGYAFWRDKSRADSSEMTYEYFKKKLRSFYVALKCIRNDALAYDTLLHGILNGKMPRYGDCKRALYYSINNYIAISPLRPLSKNNGFDGSGLHSRLEKKSDLNVNISSVGSNDIQFQKGIHSLSNKEKDEINRLFGYDIFKRFKLCLFALGYSIIGPQIMKNIMNKFR